MTVGRTHKRFGNLPSGKLSIIIFLFFSLPNSIAIVMSQLERLNNVSYLIDILVTTQIYIAEIRKQLAEILTRHCKNKFNRNILIDLTFKKLTIAVNYQKKK